MYSACDSCRAGFNLRVDYDTALTADLVKAISEIKDVKSDPGRPSRR